MHLTSLPSEEEGFKTSPVTFCGIEAILIIPEISAKWKPATMLFRSMIVNKESLEVLSIGWPKFMNYGEKPDCYPDPKNYQDWTITEKIDGSLVICDYVNEQFSMRTRGTASYITQSNAKDFELLRDQHPAIVEYLKQNPEHSLLFEIVTPNNVIVLRSETIEFYLLGGVNKATGNVLTIDEVNRIKESIPGGWQPQSQQLKVLRAPATHSFGTLDEMLAAVKDWKGKEGVVLSYNNNQNRVKFKGDWYCTLHSMKSSLNTESNLIEFYVNEGMPSGNGLFKLIENFDWEIANQLRTPIEKVATAGEEVKKEIEKIKELVKDIRNFETRKEKALAIAENCKGDYTGIAFSILDDKPIKPTTYCKLIKSSVESSTATP